MQVRGKTIPAVEIVLAKDDAQTLAHILNMHTISIDAGQQGSGSWIVEQREYCKNLAAAINKQTEGE